MKRKWAVETRNKSTGEVVRVMETPQKWTAELIRDSANQTFAKTGRDEQYESYVVTL